MDKFIEFFKDNANRNSMGRLTVFMSAFAGLFNACWIPFSGEKIALTAAAVSLFTIAITGKALNKKAEGK